MTLPEARRVFGELMKKAREGRLTVSDKAVLSRARQTLRGAAKSTMRNPKKEAYRAFVHFQRSGLNESPPYDDKWKAQRWLRDALTIAQRTGEKVVAKGIVKSKSNPGKLTRKKARKILHEGKVRGHQLTAKQRRFFGARSSGYPRCKAKRNPSSLVRMGKLVELRYHRDHGQSPGFYKHVFKSRPTLFYDRDRNRIIAG